jgi:hypothetical protein
MKLDLKTALMLATILFTGAGFYYTTISKLDDAEREISFLWSKVAQLEKSSTRLNRLLLNHAKKGSHQE